MFVVELAIVVKRNDGAEQTKIAYTDEFGARHAEEPAQFGLRIELLRIVVHIGKGAEALHAKLSQSVAAFLGNV